MFSVAGLLSYVQKCAPVGPEHTSTSFCFQEEQVLSLDAQCGEDILHQVLVDPRVSLQPLAPDADDLRPLQETHLQLEGHRHLPKVALGATLEGVPRGRERQWPGFSYVERKLRN